MSGIYPVDVEVAPAESAAQWRPLVRVVAALPHLFWLTIYSFGAVPVAVVAWFAIVFTGRMPVPLGIYLMGVLRYGWRVCALLFGLTDPQPGLDLWVPGYVDPGDFPAVFYSAQPVSRRRMRVLFRLGLLIPFLLLACLVVAALVVLLFAGWWFALTRGHWPESWRTVVVACFRWCFRVASYAWLIVDEYPPLRLETDHVTAADAPSLPTGRTADPREVTGPPWPRLVGNPREVTSTTSGRVGFISDELDMALRRRAEPVRRGAEPVKRLGRRLVPALVVLGALLLGAGMGATKGLLQRDESARAKSTPSAQAKPASHLATAAIINDLQARVMPAPAGYTGIPSFVYTNGLITPAAFEGPKNAGFSASIGLLGGYEATYQSNTSDDFIDIQLLRFSSPENARSSQQPMSVLPAELPKQSPFTGIPGAIAVDGTKPFQGVYDDEVVAIKGPVLMVLDYSAPTAGPAPVDLTGWAEQQYAHL